jgi:hypothetical protein
MNITLQDTTEIIKATAEIVKTVGLVASGIWVAWTFNKLQKAREAEAGINQKLAETQKGLAETQKYHIDQQEGMTRLLRQQPVLAIELSATESWDSDQSQGYLCVNVVLEDKGDKT